MANSLTLATVLLACALPLAAAAGRQLPAEEQLELAHGGRELKYNDYSDVSSSLSCVFSVGLISCIKARKAATQATNRAEQYARARVWTTASLHNGRGDAFRHCFWNALMVRRIGQKKAEKVATKHENSGKNPPAEKSMDLYNNNQGRIIGAISSEANSDARCKRAALIGTLRRCCGF